MGLALHVGAIGTHTGQEWLLLAQLRLLRDLLHQPGDLRASQDIVFTFLNSYRDASETVHGNHVRVSQLNAKESSFSLKKERSVAVGEGWCLNTCGSTE